MLLALALPSPAFGQATRTFVSGVGDDLNPCSRTAPCKTFAGAISKTAAGGEINCLDPGGYGTVTITKSIAIKCYYTLGSILASGTNGINVNDSATATPGTIKVTLRGLDITGAGSIGGVGQTGGTGITGVNVISGRSVHIVDSEVWGFQTGVKVVPSTSMRVLVANSHIHNNIVGVMNAPASNAISFTSVTLRNNIIADNTCGTATSAFGATTPSATDCGTLTAASGINKTAVTSIYHNGIHDNGTGVFARGAAGSAEIAYNEITGNFTFGLHRIDSGIIRTFTPATNVISNNAASDAPNASTGLTRKAKRRAHRSAARRSAY